MNVDCCFVCGKDFRICISPYPPLKKSYFCKERHDFGGYFVCNSCYLCYGRNGSFLRRKVLSEKERKERKRKRSELVCLYGRRRTLFLKSLSPEELLLEIGWRKL